jgi:hypothetical protein
MGKRNFEEVQARNRVTDTAAERTQSLEAELTELGQRLPKKITLSTDTGLDEAAIQSIIRYHKVKLSLGNIKKRQKSGERLLKHELNADTFNPDRINIANLGRLKDILEDLRENLSREELAGYTVSYDVDNNAITVRPSSKVGRGVETLVSGGTLSSGTAQTPARGIRGFFSRLIPRGLRAGRETLQLVATPKAKVTVKLANYRSVDDLIQKLAA